MGVATFRAADPRVFQGMGEGVDDRLAHHHRRGEVDSKEPGHLRHGHWGRSCPYCQHPLANPSDLPAGLTLVGGVKRIAALVFHVVGMMLRATRLVVAASFCVLAIAGSVAHRAALLVAHPADRRYLRGRREA